MKQCDFAIAARGQAHPTAQEELKKLAAYDKARQDFLARNGDNADLPAEIDYHFESHSRRVADLSQKIATSLGWSQEDKNILHTGAMLHDVGKRLMPTDIWDKTEKPDAGLKELRRTHTIIGAAYLKGDPELLGELPDNCRPLIMNHLKKNGGLTEIKNSPWKQADSTLTDRYAALARDHHKSLSAYPGMDKMTRLLACVDAYDGGCLPRPHHKLNAIDRSPLAVIDRMRYEKAGEFDSKMLNTLDRVIRADLRAPAQSGRAP